MYVCMLCMVLQVFAQSSSSSCVGSLLTFDGAVLRILSAVTFDAGCGGQLTPLHAFYIGEPLVTDYNTTTRTYNRWRL